MRTAFGLAIIAILSSCSSYRNIGGSALEQNRKLAISLASPLEGSLISVSQSSTCLSPDWKKRLEALERKISESHSPEPTDLANLADCLALSENYSGALFYYDLALANAPNDKFRSSVHSNMANMYLHSSSPALAEQMLRQSLKFNGSNHLAKYKLALVLYREAEFEASLRLLEELNRSFPKENNVLIGVAANLYQLNKIKRLKSNILPQIDDKPNVARLFSLLLGENQGDATSEVPNQDLENAFLDDLRETLVNKEQSGKNYEKKT